MAIVSRSDLYNNIKTVIGDRTDDDTIRLLEDFADTMDDYDRRVGEDWRSKYEANDAEWRRRYTDRFNGTSPDENMEGGELQNLEVETVKETENIQFEDLFE